MNSIQTKKTFLELSYVFIMLLLAAAIISCFKSYHYTVGAFFILLIVFSLIRTYNKKNTVKSFFWLSLFGVFFTSFMGLLVEIWGTSNNHWIYLNIPKNISVPFWVPFAWGLSYKALYLVERSLIQYFSTAFGKWFFCVILPAILLPIIGEIIVIYYGTWNYTWQPQYFGMPILAIILLVIFHVSILITMCKICQIFSIKDPVYSSLVRIK